MSFLFFKQTKKLSVNYTQCCTTLPNIPLNGKVPTMFFEKSDASLVEDASFRYLARVSVTWATYKFLLSRVLICGAGGPVS